MNDLFEMITSIMLGIWFLYVIVMGIFLLIGSTSLVEFFAGIFAIVILIALPAIIRGKW